MAGVTNIDGSAFEPINPPAGTSGLSMVGSKFGGGNGDGPMEPVVPVNDAIESRLSTKLDKLPTKGTIWAAVGTLFGLLLAVAAFAGDRFDGGVSASGLLSEQAEQQAAVDEAQDAKLSLIDQKLDILIRQTAEQ